MKCAPFSELSLNRSVVGDDADRIAPDMGETADQGLAVQLLEFVELRTIDQARDDVVHVEWLAPVAETTP